MDKDMLVIILLLIFFCTASFCQIGLYIIRKFGPRISCLREYLDNDNIQQLQYTIDVLSIALLWYSISLSFTFFNKWMMQVWRGGFDFPIVITTIHLSIKLIIAQLWSLSPSIEKIEVLTCRIWTAIVLPIGVLIAVDIILTNTAVLYLPLSLVTSIKGSTLIFTFLWGIVIEIEKFQWKLLIAVVGITSGLVVTVTNSVTINTIGCLCAFGAACAGGLRWALLQLLEQRDPQSKSVMVTLYRFTPASVVSILPLVFAVEGDKFYASTFWRHSKDMNDALLLCLIGGVFAFCLVVVEVKLVRLTSALTMSVFGQVKEIIQISLAMILLRENLSIKGGVGIGMSILSSLYYRYAIISKKENGTLTKNKSIERMNLLSEQEMTEFDLEH